MAWTNIILPFPVYQQSETEECEQFWKRIEGTISVNSMAQEETAFWFLLGISEEFVRKIQFDPEKSLWINPASLYENAQLIDEKVYLEGPFRKHRFQHCSNFSMCTLCGKWGHKDKQCRNGVLSSMQQSQILRKMGGLYYRAGADEPADYDEWEDPMPKSKPNGSSQPVYNSANPPSTFYEDVNLEETNFTTVNVKPNKTETVPVQPKPELRQEVTAPAPQVQLSNAEGDPSSTEKAHVSKSFPEANTSKPANVSSDHITGTESSNTSSKPSSPKLVTKVSDSSPAKVENIPIPKPEASPKPKVAEAPNQDLVNSSNPANVRTSSPSTFKALSSRQSSPQSPYSRPAGPRPSRPVAPGGYSGPQNRAVIPGGYSGPQNRPAAAPGGNLGPQNNRSTAPGRYPGPQNRLPGPRGHPGPQNRLGMSNGPSGPQNRPAAPRGFVGSPTTRPFRDQAPRQQNIVWETPNREGHGNNPNQNVWEDQGNSNQSNTWELPERGRKHLQNLQRFSNPH